MVRRHPCCDAASEWGGRRDPYVHTDHLNTPRIITDTANNIRWRWDSDLFGNTPPNEDPSGIGTFTYNLRFPGQQYDAVVGLHYNYFRNYDSTVGRYVESDPIGLKGGINTYAYVSGNPLQKADAYGLLETPKPRPPVEEEEWGPSLTGPSICGAEGGKKFPMDFGTSSFEVPCRNHDRCYEICGKSRLECDEAFLRDAKDECKNPAVKRMGGIFSICEGMANHYYTALREGGRDAYLKAQRKNGCCNPQPD